MTLSCKKGFTLIEVVVAAGLFSVTTLVAFFLAASFYKNYVEIQENVEAEKSLVMAIYHLQKSLSLATKLNVVADPSITLAPTSEGRIRAYSMESMNGNPGQIDTIAVYLREDGGYQSPPLSRFVPTGIFYARPSPTTSGVIFITSNTAAGISANLTPSYNGVFFEKIVGLSMTDFTYVAGKLTSLEISVTSRRFLDNRVARWNFCPNSDIVASVAGCSASGIAPFKDINLKTRVALSNQIISPTDGRSSNPNAPYERTFGNLYLFPQR